MRGLSRRLSDPKHKYESISQTAEIINNNIHTKGIEHLTPEQKPDIIVVASQ